MKKRISVLILSLAMIIVTLFSAAGCGFINDGGSSDNGGSQESGSTYSKTLVNVDLKDSSALSDGITFVGKSRPSSGKYGSVDEVLEATKVDRASVAIRIELANSLVSGSGIIVNIDDGIDYGEKEDNIFYVLTCHHVIDSCEGVNNSITLYVPDENGKNFDESNYDDKFAFTGKIGGSINEDNAVSLIGGDKASDVALLRLYVAYDVLASKIIKANIMSEEYSLKKGEDVFAIGFSEGEHAGWTTKGVVAKTEENCRVSDIGTMTLTGINVNIYPGNSGGGLFNMYGELVGITNSGETVTVDNDEVPNGINFAIPHKITTDSATDKGFINVAKQLLGTYTGKNYGYVSGRKEKLGMSLSAEGNSVVVAAVTDNSFAAGAGLKAGDVVRSAMDKNNKRYDISSVSDFDAFWNTVKVGDSFSLNVVKKVSANLKSYTFKAYQVYFCNTCDYSGISA